MTVQQYLLKRSKKRKKTICLQIGRNSEIIVYAPSSTPVGEINRFIEEKKSWIDKTRRAQLQASGVCREKSYITGESFYYLGRLYPLEAYYEPLENTGVIFWQERFFLNCPENPEMRKACLAAWYKRNARSYLNQRVAFYEDLLKLKSGGLKITSAAGRWGSCSADNHLNFSFRLMMATPSVIDYVIIHELMHLRQKNHSAKFWRQVAEVMPDYQACRRWLRGRQQYLIL